MQLGVLTKLICEIFINEQLIVPKKSKRTTILLIDSGVEWSELEIQCFDVTDNMYT